MPPVDLPGMWPNKVQAIASLEKSLFDDRPRALIQMATGTGKTLLAVTEIYRLIKFAGARRVLFLVDRANLGEQAEKGHHRGRDLAAALQFAGECGLVYLVEPRRVDRRPEDLSVPRYPMDNGNTP